MAVLGLVHLCIHLNQQPESLLHVNGMWLVCNSDYNIIERFCVHSLLFLLLIFAIPLAFIEFVPDMENHVSGGGFWA